MAADFLFTGMLFVFIAGLAFMLYGFYSYENWPWNMMYHVITMICFNALAVLFLFNVDTFPSGYVFNWIFLFLGQLNFFIAIVEAARGLGAFMQNRRGSRDRKRSK